jgi:hypothetical protein
MATASVLERPAVKAEPPMDGGGGAAGAVAPPAASRVGLAVDVPLLLRSPEEALLPALRLLPGPWEGAALEDLQVVAMSGALSEWAAGGGRLQGGGFEQGL